ncbi:hypothetical protein TNIN_499821 [Trichonephila inaurata madagascariensis]|uniref:Uncharacterized protein n=1 Tax=Trichonephila inaurata madagascariensis TaxID=2747483 RepID=A0A8X7BPJ6_9ARAC|nr:hypothetical protein TNIN_499821 [Trichonephila inaurata madagascariensis]
MGCTCDRSRFGRPSSVVKVVSNVYNAIAERVFNTARSVVQYLDAPKVIVMFWGYVINNVNIRSKLSGLTSESYAGTLGPLSKAEVNVRSGMVRMFVISPYFFEEVISKKHQSLAYTMKYPKPGFGLSQLLLDLALWGLCVIASPGLSFSLQEKLGSREDCFTLILRNENVCSTQIKCLQF